MEWLISLRVVGRAGQRRNHFPPLGFSGGHSVADQLPASSPDGVGTNPTQQKRQRKIAVNTCPFQDPFRGKVCDANRAPRKLGSQGRQATAVFARLQRNWRSHCATVAQCLCHVAKSLSLTLPQPKPQKRTFMSLLPVLI